MEKSFFNSSEDKPRTLEQAMDNFVKKVIQSKEEIIIDSTETILFGSQDDQLENDDLEQSIIPKEDNLTETRHILGDLIEEYHIMTTLYKNFNAYDFYQKLKNGITDNVFLENFGSLFQDLIATYNWSLNSPRSIHLDFKKIDFFKDNKRPLRRFDFISFSHSDK